MVGGIGAAVALVLVIVVIVLLVGGGDDGPAPPDRDDAPVADTSTRPAQPAPQRVRTPELVTYVPAETPMAFGVRFADGQGAGDRQLATLAAFLRAPMVAAGLTPDQVAETVFACDPKQHHLIAGIRARVQLDPGELRERLGCDDRGEEVAGTSVYTMAAFTAWGQLAASFPSDGRTMLLGRAETLKAALTARSQGGNPSVRALDLSAGSGPRFWVAAAEINEQILGVGHRLLPTTWRFPQGSRDAARAIKSFGASVDFTDEMRVQIQVECRDDEKASELAGLIDGALTLLENPPKAPTSSSAAASGPGAAAGGADSYNPFPAGAVATSSGQSVADTTQDGTRATIVWETSHTGAAARFAWSFLTGMALASLSPSAEGEELFPGPLRRASAGLLGLYAANQAFPTGAAPREDVHLLQRVSWMAQVLPHLGLNNLYERIDFETDWSEGENAAVAGTLVGAFLDPRAEEYRWEGYPFHNLALTHYVGMAGLGRNAAELPADDPRAGIFGYERSVKLDDITDGAANTIMLISAGEIYGPWMAPGGATVRGAQEPYFSGMSGFRAPGTQPGAVAAFADGSVRFIAADTDAKVFAAMCTMHGND